ncbi:MAG: FAD-dependent oxidoreductase [Candidatus Hydrogenedentes bacterium]|nr:FAD-dependent oxidoreductase [Candidatus Hydrogenedentota bacterium]
MLIRSLLATSVLCASVAAQLPYDVVVVGATPGGISAAVSAARLGHSVALVEYRAHVGGLTASGLGKSDITKADAIGGLWDEFVGRVLEHYVKTYGADSDQVVKCKNGYFYEPSVAENIFQQMLGEQQSITILLRHRLDEVVRRDRSVSAVRVTNRDTGATIELRGKIFIDATYEGDLAAYAGAAYRVGRESRAEFDEPHAGVIYMDHKTRALLPGTTGEGDDRLVAYTYRLCLTTNPDRRVLPEKPEGYDRSRYLNYLLDLKLGRLDSAVKALSIAEIPNQKYDANMKPWPLGFPFAEENAGYAEADWATREKIEARLRNLTLGLLYFLQNDPDVPETDRALARTYGLPSDEFTGNGNFPWALYVREARRIIGEYTLSERDLTLAPDSARAPVHADAISAGEFPIDSFPTRKYEPGHETALEGYILMLNVYTQPYQIPYRVMIPKDVDGLIVPVACSATHIAFSSVRLEPTWMSLGQAAGVAAHLAIAGGTTPRNVPITALQQMLVDQAQVLTYFDDLPKDHPAFKAFQFLGTKGLFSDYHARPGDPLLAHEAFHWLACLYPELPVDSALLPVSLNAAMTGQEWIALCKSAGLTISLSKNAGEGISRADAIAALYAGFVNTPKP